VHTLRAEGTDSVGNIGFDEVTVTVLAPDNQAPTVEITSPTDGATIQQPNSFEFSATCTDNVACEQVRFTAEGVNLGVDNTDPYSVTVDSTQLTPGVHVLQAEGIDPSGRIGVDEVTVTVVPATPAAPSNLHTTAVTSSNIDLAWDDNSNNETGFRLERKTGTGGTYSQLGGDLPANTTTFSDTTVDPNTTYCYRVKAFNAGGESAFSNETCATTPDDQFTFTGFFPPVDNPPVVNSVKAGRAIPVKFSLGGDQGLDIFAAGYPVSQQVSCTSGAPENPIEETVTAGGSSLSYNPETDQYAYVWKTQKNWSNTCRQLIVKLTDNTEHTAIFRFN
jgi:hypothetical protein